MLMTIVLLGEMVMLHLWQVPLSGCRGLGQIAKARPNPGQCTPASMIEKRLKSTSMVGRHNMRDERDKSYGGG
jgi:hypothetical protein